MYFHSEKRPKADNKKVESPLSQMWMKAIKNQNPVASPIPVGCISLFKGSQVSSSQTEIIFESVPD